MENKDDILKGLYGIKEELSKEIFELENKLYLTRCSLDDINDENGNKVYCYKRVCSICGKEEIAFDINDTKILSKKK